MKNISYRKLKNLKDILAKDYGMVLDIQQLAEFGERMLRLTVLAEKHHNRRLVDGFMRNSSAKKKHLASSDKLGLD